MARKPITQVNGYVLSNLDDRDSVLTTLLKRVCTFEEAVDYLLSAVPGTIKDDMLGELVTWDGRRAEMLRIRSDRREGQARAEDKSAQVIAKVPAMEAARDAGKSTREIALEFGVSANAVQCLVRRARPSREQS
jgi:hypothetical protein